MTHTQYHTSTHAIARRILADSSTGLCFHVCNLHASGELPVNETRSRAALAFALLAEVGVKVGGVEITRLGRRHKAEPVVKLQTPREIGRAHV